MPLTSWTFSVLQYSEIRKNSMKFVNLKISRILKVLRSYYTYCSLCVAKVSWFSDLRCSVPAETRNQQAVLFLPKCALAEEYEFHVFWEWNVEKHFRYRGFEVRTYWRLWHNVEFQQTVNYSTCGTGLIWFPRHICVFITTAITDHTKE